MRAVWIIFYAGRIQAVLSTETKAKEFCAFQGEHQLDKVDLWSYEVWLVE